MGSGGGDQVKVKIIVTQFVTTDAVQFKSVVQTLTGNDVGGGGGGDPVTPPGGTAGPGAPRADPEARRRLLAAVDRCPSIPPLL
ncbi:unnamed protein product [Spirodela intermedia]|uniref:VQ domain-containing protein n=1 Tax=Spirodela intermedia TaxID=51605 RepID=A0A7I8ISR9_SPIIN|nr:unnamed protein product [Spirodela intermedia]CAA6661061.1 unnamed protein product [Spirodela intermedia]